VLGRWRLVLQCKYRSHLSPWCVCVCDQTGPYFTGFGLSESEGLLPKTGNALVPSLWISSFLLEKCPRHQKWPGNPGPNPQMRKKKQGQKGHKTWIYPWKSNKIQLLICPSAGFASPRGVCSQRHREGVWEAIDFKAHMANQVVASRDGPNSEHHGDVPLPHAPHAMNKRQGMQSMPWREVPSWVKKLEIL